MMSLKNLSHKDKALLVAGVCCVILVFGILFLGFQFAKIDKVGVQCMSSPLIYAESRLFEDYNEIHDCSCILKDSAFVFVPNR